MTSQELKDLAAEIDEIRIDQPITAITELRSALSAIADHLYFRQLDTERNRS